MSLFSRKRNEQRNSRHRKNSKRIALLESLEVREVPAIALVGTELRVTGGNLDDVVAITHSSVGSGQVIATRTQTGHGQQSTESQRYPSSAVTRVFVKLGNGINQFVNQTSLPSRVLGGADRDVMSGGTGVDEFYGEGGNDTLWGRGGNDILEGAAGHDILEGGDGNDVLNGGDGNDHLKGEAGNDSIRGGEGNDFAQGGDHIDQIQGNGGNDVLWGENGNDSVWGNDGDDRIEGNGGNDQLYGDGGEDFITGGSGSDHIEGGSGDDLLAANATRLGFNQPERPEDLEDTAGNTLSGGTGNDRLVGSNKDDVLYGNDGNDWLSGLIGNDQLYGGLGKDVLLGGSGFDTLSGGLDVDRIVSIDGANDWIVPQPVGSAVDRDELWIDAVDSAFNQSAITAVQAEFPASVHIVAEYRRYQVSGALQVQPPLNWGEETLIDPAPRPEHEAIVQQSDFGNSPLFGPDGPVWDDIEQGVIGTCYFLARIAALAKTNPQHIRDMVTELGDGTFVVRFLNKDAQPVYVRVDGDLYHKGNLIAYARLGSGSSMWVAIVEKAWAIQRYGYATYNSIIGGNGVQNSDLTETAQALGIKDTKISQADRPTPQTFANMLKTFLDEGRGVVFGGRSFIGDTMPLTNENFRSGEHILMVHSVDTDTQGNVIKIHYYDLYGGPLKEMSNLDVFFFGCGGITAFKPIA